MSWYHNRYQHIQQLARGALAFFTTLLLGSLSLIISFGGEIPTPPTNEDQEYVSATEAVEILELSPPEALSITIFNTGLSLLGLVLAMSIGWKTLNMIVQILLYEELPPSKEWEFPPITIENSILQDLQIQGSVSANLGQWIKTSSTQVGTMSRMLQSAIYRLAAVVTVVLFAIILYFLTYRLQLTQVLIADFVIGIGVLYLFIAEYGGKISFEYGLSFQSKLVTAMIGGFALSVIVGVVVLG